MYRTGRGRLRMDPATPPLPEAASSSGWFPAIVVSLILGIGTVIWLRVLGNPLLQKAKDDAKEEEEEEEERVTQEIPPEHMPKDGIFTIKSLKRFNGLDLPICMGVCGEVVNVSSSSNIEPGQAGYGKLWAGNDATYSLATLSLKPEDADKLDYKLEDFTADQQKALAGWYKHFTTKYPIIGRMKEYEGWDFSSIHKLAENETPFASSQKAKGDSNKEDTKQIEKATAESSQRGSSAREGRASEVELANGEKIQVPENAKVLSSGCGVTLAGLDEASNGRRGILMKFRPEKKKFEVFMSDTGEVEYFDHANLIVS